LLAYSFVKDQGLAEDVSQEVFIKCYKHIGNFRKDASIKSWIYRITVNTSKDFVRKKSFQVLKFPKLLFENIKKSESSEETFLKQNQNDLLLHTVLSLPSKYREVIVLYYFHDLKVNEIGETLDLNTNTVKTRLTRGRSILKENLVFLKGDAFNG
jgi:RNA polymerase sigma-70 factor (ECF subfamily)